MIATFLERRSWNQTAKMASVAAVVAAAVLAMGPAQAQVTWDSSFSTSGPQDGAGTWSTLASGTNWWNGTTNVAWPSGNIATFGAGGTAGTVTVSGSVNAGGLTFGSLASGNYTLSSGTIGLTTGGTISLVNGATINSVLTGSNISFMNNSGTNTITLGGANRLTGTIAFRSPSPSTVLNFGSGTSALGAATIDIGTNVAWVPPAGTYTNNIVLSGIGNPANTRGAIRVFSGNLTFTGSMTLAGDASIWGNSGLLCTITQGIGETAGGAKSLTLNNSNGIVYLQGQSSYSGATSLGIGTFVLEGGANRLPQTTSLTIGDGNGPTKLVLGGTLGGAMNQAISGLVATNTLRASVVGGASGTSTLTVDIASGTNTYQGIFGGTAANENNLALTKSGAGVLSLTGTSYTYTGNTTISGGTLALGASAPALSSSGVIRVGSAGSSNVVFDLSARSGTYAFGPNQTVTGIGRINFGTGKTVAAQGIWAPGNSIGSNAVTGNLSLSGTSQFELGTPGTSAANPGVSDFTAVSGTLRLGGNLTLLDNAGADGNGSAAGGVYRLFTYGSAVTGSFTGVTTNPTPTTRTSLANISYGGSGTAAGQGVLLSIYNLAAGSVSSGTSINFGTVLKGTSLSQALSITNTAPNTYSEKLDATFGSPTGDASTNGGLINLLAAGGTSTAMSVGLDSATAGSKTGSVLVNFASNGDGTSGLGSLSLAPQTVNLVGAVLDPAVASFTTGSTTTSWLLDFGSVDQNASVSPLAFSLFNLMQTNGFTADLALLSIDETNPSGPFSTNLSLFNTLAAGTSSSYTASFATATLGAFSNVYTLTFKSSNGGNAYAADTPQTLTLTVQGVIAVPEPGTACAAAIGGVACVGWWAWRRRRRS